MSFWIRRMGAIAVALACGALAASCGGGDSLAGDDNSGGTGPVASAANVVAVAVSAGPNNDATNLLYTTITVCVPGTTDCQTIDNILVDTGSTGLRLLAPVVTLTIPTIVSGSATLGECYGYVDGYAWGPVATVDLTVSGEKASSVPVQLIGDARLSTVPDGCSGLGTNENTVASFGANGILGIGFQPEDCGIACANQAIPGTYYSCTTTTCTSTAVNIADQLPNPVTMFPTDNNGTIISLSSAASGGAATVSGSLIFGIDTETNNASSSATLLTVDGTETDLAYGTFTVVFNSQTLPESFIDSGSNGYYFNDSSLTTCPSPNNDFYCPSSAQNLTASVTGYGATAKTTVSFTVTSADTVPDGDTAYPGLAGTTSLDDNFDFGLPFYYGKRVVTAIEGVSTSSGNGPYVAF